MALSKTKFQVVADKLFAKASDGGLVVSATFKELGAWDPISETTTGDISETITTCIREEFDAYQINNDSIQRDDFKLLVRVSSFSKLLPRIDKTKVTVNSLSCSIINLMKDTADAVYTLHLRAG